MNAEDVYMYGHGWVLKHLEGLNEEDWIVGGTCGVWSIKDIVAHLTSFEYLLAEAFEMVQGGKPGEYMISFGKVGDQEFNNEQVASRVKDTYQEVLDEYEKAHSKGAANLVKIPIELRRKVGAIPWYGEEYDVEDLISYMYYGHKREHCAQIAVFRDTLDTEWQS